MHTNLVYNKGLNFPPSPLFPPKSPGVMAVEHVPVRQQQRPQKQAVEGTHRHVGAVAGSQPGVEVV